MHRAHGYGITFTSLNLYERYVYAFVHSIDEAGGIMFAGCPSGSACVRACVRSCALAEAIGDRLAVDF